MKSETVDEQVNPEFVLVCEENSPDDTLELPLESNGTLAQSTLQAQFPGATGLKYKKEGSDRFRGVRVSDGYIYPPEDGSWANIVFVATFPKGVVAGKRKVEDESHGVDGSNAKESKLDKTTSDLIVLSLPYKAGEAELRQYFSQFGQIASCDIKRDKNGHSRGFGFIRFNDIAVQDRVIGMRHYIDGRWCDVKIPNSQIIHESNQQPSNCSSRVFVGRLAANVTEEEIRTFFSKFGEVSDIYLPRPFRSCAFVTFRDISVAQSLVGKEFSMDGNDVHIACANPRVKDGGNVGGGGRDFNRNNNNRMNAGRGGSFNQKPVGYSNNNSFGGRSGVRSNTNNNKDNSNGHMSGNQSADMMSYFGGFGNFGGQGMFPGGAGGMTGNMGGGGRAGNGASGYNRNSSSNAGNNMPPMVPGGPANMMNSAAFIAALSNVISQSGGWPQNSGTGSGQFSGSSGSVSGSQNPYSSSASGNFSDYSSQSGGSGSYGGPGGFGGNNSAMYR